MIYWFLIDIIFFERQRKKYNHERLLDKEIVALQSELAKFILAKVLEKDGVFFIAQSMKYENISFLFWVIEILIRTFEL